MEKETVDEKRAKEWLSKQPSAHVSELLVAYAESECSRLASRVEELENLIAKHSGSLSSGAHAEEKPQDV